MDPFDMELDTSPYDTWKLLRDEAPVYRNDGYDFSALSRYANVEAAHRDPRAFSSVFDDIFHIEPGVGVVNDSSLAAMIEAHGYFTEQLERRRVAPTDDISAISSGPRSTTRARPAA